MSELIDRQQTIDAVAEALRGLPVVCKDIAEEVIDEMPTIHPEPHWIPVKEEPNERMICYVTLKDTNDENRPNWVAEMIYTPWDGFDLMDGIEAIAWMPKQYPEPYKGVNT